MKNSAFLVVIALACVAPVHAQTVSVRAREIHNSAIVIDTALGQVFVNRKAIDLSAKEYALLAYMYEHAGRVCSKDEIAKAVWPEYKGEVFDYQIESLIKRLRQKLEPDTDESHLIITLRGRGYRLAKS